MTKVKNSAAMTIRARLIYPLLAVVCCLLIVNCSENKPAQKSAPDFSIATLNGHKGPISSISFSPDGKQILSAGRDGKLFLWDVATRKIASELSGGGVQLRTAAISPDGKLAASGDDKGIVRIYDLAGRKLLLEFKADDVSVLALSFDPTSAWIVTGGKDQKVKLWEPSTGKQSGIFEGSFDRVNTVAFSPDGKYILAGSSGAGIRVWRRADGKLQQSHYEYNGEIYCVAMNAERGLVFAGGSVGDTAGKREGRVRIWHYPDAKELLSFAPHRLVTSSVSISAEANLIATASTVDPVIRLWDIESGNPIGTLIGHSKGVNTVDISSDGKFLASGGEDGAIKIWNLGSVQAAK